MWNVDVFPCWLWLCIMSLPSIADYIVTPMGFKATKEAHLKNSTLTHLLQHMGLLPPICSLVLPTLHHMIMNYLFTADFIERIFTFITCEVQNMFPWCVPHAYCWMFLRLCSHSMHVIPRMCCWMCAPTLWLDFHEPLELHVWLHVLGGCPFAPHSNIVPFLMFHIFSYLECKHGK